MADQYTPLPVKGLKTNNSTAPTNDQVPVMPATATNAAPSFTEGNEVKLSTDLAGNLRVTVTNAQVEITNDAGNPLPISRTTAANATANPIFTQITNGTANNATTAPLFAQITNGTANNSTTAPLFAQLTNGTTNLASGSGTAAGSLRVSPATDVTVNVSRNQTANSTTNALFAQLTNGTANLTSGSGVTGTDTLRVNVATDNTVNVSRNQTANSTTNALFTQLTNGTANLTSGSGVTGTDTLRVNVATDNTVNVSRNQTANSVTNGIFTTLTDGTAAIGTSTNPLFVQSDFSAGAPKATAVTTASVAAGASTTLNGAAITTGKVGQLAKVWVTASVRYKAVIESFNGTTATTIAVMFGEAYTTQYFEPVDNTLFTQAGGTGNVFRVTMTNGDNVFAADLYAHIQWFEV